MAFKAIECSSSKEFLARQTKRALAANRSTLKSSGEFCLMIRFGAFVLFLGGLSFQRGFHLFGRELDHRLAHFLAGLELHHGALRDGHVRLRRVGIAAHAGLAHLHFEHAEVAQLHLLAGGDGGGDVVEGFLDDIQNLLLDEASFVADPDYEVTLGHKVFGNGYPPNFFSTNFVRYMPLPKRGQARNRQRFPKRDGWTGCTSP